MTDPPPTRAPSERTSRTRAARFRRFARSPLAGVVLAAICTLTYLPGLLTMPPVDRDESRFAQASRQMVDGVRTGLDNGSAGEVVEALAVPRVQDRPRLNKPPLIYWLQAIPASVLDSPERDLGRDWLAGTPLEDTAFEASVPTGNIGAFRLVSALCAVLAALFTWRLGLRLLDPRAAWIGALFLGVCVMVQWDARQARADQLLLACTAASMWALASAWCSAKRPGNRRRLIGDATTTVGVRIPWSVVLALWVAVGLGVLAKGPITPMVIVLGVVMYAWATRSWRFVGALRPLTGGLIVVAMCLPWLGAVAWAQGGIAAYAHEVWQEVFVRAAGGKEHFVPIPGYHAVLTAVLFFPGSLLTLAGVCRAWRAARRGKLAGHGTDRKREQGSGKRDQAEPRARRPLWGVLRGGFFTPSAEALLLCLIIPAWVIFEATPAKLPHYTLPLYPALALLTARALLSAQAGSLKDVRTWGSAVGAIVFALIISKAFMIVGLVLMLSGGVVPVWLACVMMGGVYLSGLCLMLVLPGPSLRASGGKRRKLIQDSGTFHRISAAWRERLLHRPLVLPMQLTQVSIGAIAIAATLGFALPHLHGPSSTWLSSQIVGVLEEHAVPNDAPVFARGYAEDSLIFLTRGRAQRIDQSRACAWLEGDRPPGSVLILKTGTEPEQHLLNWCPGATIAAGEVGDAAGIQGFNTANGDWVFVNVYFEAGSGARSALPPEQPPVSR